MRLHFTLSEVDVSRDTGNNDIDGVAMFTQSVLRDDLLCPCKHLMIRLQHKVEYNNQVFTKFVSLVIRYEDDPSCLTVDYCCYVPVRSKFTHSSSLRNMAYRRYIMWTLSVYVLIGKTLTCQGNM